MSVRRKVRPANAAEARELMQNAIEGGDFEGAKEFYNEIDFLQNFQNEYNLARDVHDYYVNKQVISNNLDSNCKIYQQQIAEARSQSNEFFQSEYLLLKEKQETELNNFLDKWETARDKFIDTTEQEYQRTMTTARLIASQLKFDDAIKIRNKAERKLKSGLIESQKECDKHYKRQAALLLERHQLEITALSEKRKVEMKLFDALDEAAESEVLDSFLIKNANAVVEIANRFSPESFIPKSLQMQTVRGKLPPPKSDEGSGPVNERLDPLYFDHMEHLDQTIGASTRSAIGQSSRTVLTKSAVKKGRNNQELSDSFALAHTVMDNY